MATWGRTLKRNDDVTIPGTVICVAVATTVEPDLVNPRKRIHRLRCGHAFAGRMEDGKWTREKSVKFTCAAEFWSWTNFVRQSQKPVWIFAHDASRLMTLTSFFTALSSSEFTLSLNPATDLKRVKSERLRRKLSQPIPGLLIEADPPTAIVCWHRARWKLTIVDTRNYWDKSTEELATLSGTPAPLRPSTQAPQANHELWCQRTAEITRECVVRLCGWHKRQAMGLFGLTVSSMALSGFRHRWMQHDIEIPASADDRDFERRAYYNGRCEPLWIGEVRSGLYHPPRGLPMDWQLSGDCPRGPFHLIDARSFYGAVSQFQAVPFRCVAEGNGWPDADSANPGLSGEYLAEVSLDTSSETFPIRTDSGVAFCSGRFTTVLCGPELCRAVRTDSVVSVGRWRLYETDLIFRGYAVGLYMEREAAEGRGDGLTASLCKALLARLHGKFLQRDHKWEIVTDEPCPGPWRRWHVINQETGRMDNFRSVGWAVQRQREAGDKSHTFPAIGAWITATGREWLLTWMKLAGDRHVFYCSTDSLIVDDVGRTNLEQAGIIGDYGIGSCRIVESADSLAIYGANHYRIGGKFCFAGIPRDGRTDRSGNVRYFTSAALRQRLCHQPTDQITEIEQVAMCDAKRETQRWTEGGWLKPVTLNEGDISWKSVDFGIPS